MQNKFQIVAIITLFQLSLLSYSCHTQGELLWVKKMKKGKPPICVSNHLASKNDSAFVYPIYKLEVGIQNEFIYFNKRKVYQSSLFLDYENECIELYKSTFVFVSERKAHEDIPINVKRNEIIIIELASPVDYYIVRFKEPINLISSEFIEQNNTFITKSGQHSFVQLNQSYNFYLIKRIEIKNQEIVLKKVIKTKDGLYKINENREDLRLPLTKFKNPCLQ